MADNNMREKEWEKNDPVVGANTTANDEPVASEPSTPVEKDVDKDNSSFERDGEKEVSHATAAATAGDAVARIASRRSAFTQNTDYSAAGEPALKKSWNPFKRNPPPVPPQRGVSAEYLAGRFSRLIFNWMNPIMTLGYQRTLELNDIWLVNPNRSTRVLADKLNASFAKRRARGEKRPLLWAMFDTVKYEFVVGGLCQLVQSMVQVVAPFLMRFLIAFSETAWYAQARHEKAPPIDHGIGIVLGILALQICSSLCNNHFLYRGMMVGGQIRAVLMTVIFDKAMKISGRARAGGQTMEAPPPDLAPGSEEERKWYEKMFKKDKMPNNGGKAGVIGDGRGWSNGRIVNLMSTDTYRIDQASGFFHMMWTAPLQILVSLILLCVNLTYSALAGFALLIIAMPILARVVRGLLVRRIAINKITDQRVTMTQEILQSVRFVKFFGWETSFLDRIFAIRKREIFSIQKLLATRNAINAASMSVPVFASMISFIVFSVTQHPLDPAPVFSSLALFNSLRMPLNFLPLVLGQVIDAISSIRRIQEFLLAEEQEDSVVWDYENKNAVVVEHADFTWERSPDQDPDQVPGKAPMSKKEMKQERSAQKKAAKIAYKNWKKGEVAVLDTTKELEPYKITDMDFIVGRDELVAVIGSVGSGKSSLLAALAGDMRKTAGSITMGARRAFCPQYAWIQNSTVRENIVFGQRFDQRWYDRVVDACALRPDFEMLPDGDRTEIGERGITVSGGQKQRLNIARAIYFNADVVLLDDPLSAVDAHVGRHIMDNAICGLLKGKARILVTHQLHVLNRCDRIVWMDGGRIKTIDTFANLMESNLEFQKLMETTTVEQEKNKDKEEVNDEVDEEKKDANAHGKKKAKALMTAEERATDSVDWGVYAAYLKAAGGYWVAPIVLITLLMAQCSNISTSLWLSFWTSNKFHYSRSKYIGIYAALGFSQSLSMFCFSLSLSVFGTQASKHMLRDAMRRVLRAPMSFFDTTPLGRITNRFARDIDTMDNNLTDSMRMYFMTLGMIIGVFALIIAYFHYFAVALAPLFVGFCFSAAYYRASAREIKRLEAVQRSYVFSRFSEGVSGVATIRAYKLEDQFSNGVRDAIDSMNGCYFLTFSNQRWLSIRLDAIGNLLVFTCGILVVTSRFTVNPSIGGLVLSYILSIIQMITFTVRQLAEVENNMNSTERLYDYATNLEEEAPLKLMDLPANWPDGGEIVFKDVDMRYRAGLPLVLRGLNLHVAPGERVGIVGRTGAGKSSIMSTLFRMTELSGGSITIDDIDVGKVGLADLRSRMSIIPQDPTLFRGTIRSNLDPFGEHSDLELWTALRAADLVDSDTIQTADTLKDQPAVAGEAKSRIHLESLVEEEGLNFSLGQRQMMALARALVRGSRIIVCDEATSSVDFETDLKIQHTIMTAFKGKTLLCIAHRLKTILSYDRIVVMDQGAIAEVDTPIGLYDANGIFRGMCDRSSIKREEVLGASQAK